MASLTRQAQPPMVAGSDVTRNTLFMLARYLFLMVANAFGLIVIYSFLYDGNPGLAVVVAIIVLGANVITFVPRLYPLRWMIPGLMFVTLLVIYPIAYTVQTAFTNYSNGHLFSKDRAISLILNQDRSFIAPGALQYRYNVYVNEAGEYALWMTRTTDEGMVETVFAPANAPITPVENAPEDAPAEYNGYRLLERGEVGRALQTLQTTVFGTGEDTAGIVSTRAAARPTSPRYTYDPAADTITDLSDNRVYVANDRIGAFVPRGGTESDALIPGYVVNVGFTNFTRIFTDPALSGPVISIFAWTVVFALMSVLTTFALGLMMALILNDPMIPARKFIRSAMLIPYAIPGVISVLVWQGLLNSNFGLVTTTIESLTGFKVPWFGDPLWAKVAVILVNLWLGYPYMMLICSGALQGIPSEVYEAAAVDGARPWQRFLQITLPLLLISVGPLLIGSFTYNFNNYMMIQLLTSGGPPIPGSPVPAGYTDLLINYTYNQAFGTNPNRDFGYASAITIIIFLIVASVTMIQFRVTRTWEQVSENV